MNSFMPATIATTPKRIAIAPTLVMSKRNMMSAKTSHAMPPRKNSHHHSAASLEDLALLEHVVQGTSPSSSRIQPFPFYGRHSSPYSTWPPVKDL